MNGIFYGIVVLSILVSVVWVVDWIKNRRNSDQSWSTDFLKNLENLRSEIAQEDLDSDLDMIALTQMYNRLSFRRVASRLNKTQKIIILTLLCLANAIVLSILLFLALGVNDPIFLLIGTTAAIFEILLAVVTLLFDKL
jgi:hypothetical protein